MRVIDLSKRKINLNAFINYGFNKNDNYYFFYKSLPNYPFVAHFYLKNNELECSLIDEEFNEEYNLVDVSNLKGYSKLVNLEYESIINDIILKCSIKYKTQLERIIDYVCHNYNDNLEHLWDKNPANAIIRRKDNKKWYCLFMKVEAKRLKINKETVLDVIDLRGNEDTINSIDNKIIFPGYHMNKKHWFTLILDERMSDESIINLINKSYLLAK